MVEVVAAAVAMAGTDNNQQNAAVGAAKTAVMAVAGSDAAVAVAAMAAAAAAVAAAAAAAVEAVVVATAESAKIAAMAMAMADKGQDKRERRPEGGIGGSMCANLILHTHMHRCFLFAHLYKTVKIEIVLSENGRNKRPSG